MGKWLKFPQKPQKKKKGKIWKDMDAPGMGNYTVKPKTKRDTGRRNG